MEEEFNTQVYTFNPEEYSSFIKTLKDAEPEEIEKIITRYILYRPEMTEAALYAAVDKGMITYELKEKITEQIRLNYSGKAKYAKLAIWEKDNAFKQYVSRYSDDKLYEIIDDPSDIVIDVYHAVLSAAKDRELISHDDFENLFSEGLKSARNESELLFDRFNELFVDPDIEEPGLTDEEIEVHRSEYWKCPSCHELVDIDLDLCWKCQTEKPQVIERPDKQEIIRELQPISTYKPLKTGFIMIISGAAVFVSSFFRYYSRTIPWDERYLTLAFTSLFIIVGMIFIFIGLSGKSEKNEGY